MRSRVVVGACFTLLAVVTACGQEAAPDPAQVPDPLKTARELLSLHDVLGKQPEDRPDQSKEQQVDPQALAAVIADLDGRDPFITDLYVGFVVGALSRYQDKLVATASAGRATVVAGRARIAMKLDDRTWKIVLEESVPQEIVERAAAEKRRFDEAKARGAQ